MIPLSFAQRRLWFLNRLEGASSTYNAPVVVRLDGVPRPAVLEQALADLVHRHEVLRTRYLVHEGEPYPHAVPPGDVRLTLVDLRALTANGTAGGLWPVEDAAGLTETLVNAYRCLSPDTPRQIRAFFETNWSYQAIGRRAVAVYACLLERAKR